MKLLKNLRITTIGWIFVLVLGAAGMAFIATEAVTVQNISRIESAWERFEQSRSEKARALNALRREIGYGGMIHGFKNFVLRQGREHADVVHTKLGGAYSALARYRALGLSGMEKTALQEVEKVLVAYADALTEARSLAIRGGSAVEIDRRVRVNDAAAIRGLGILDREALKSSHGAGKVKSHTQILAQMRQTLGYGGMIHNFKNFILRHDHDLLKVVNNDIANAFEALNAYDDGNLNDAEKEAVLNIAGVINAYTRALITAEKMADFGDGPEEIDRQVRIDDSPAFSGFDVLVREIAYRNANEAEQVRASLRLVYSLVESTSWMAGIVMGFLIVMSLWLIRSRIIAPISRMTEAMSSLAAGNLEQDIPEVGRDNEIGRMAQAVGVFKTNAIERRLAEGEIRNREARIRAVFDNVVDGIITIDEMGAMETFNNAAESMFGYAPDEVVGRNVKMLMPDPYQKEHDGYLGNYRDTGEKQIIGTGREVEGLRKDGSTFPIDLAVSEMEIGGKRMFAGIVRDITYRKQAEKSKSEFISTVSHELRTPLTSIKGSLGLVRSGAAGELPDKMRPMIEIAHSNSERLVRLINDILDIEKIAAGKMEFFMQDLNLHELAEHAIEANKGYGEERAVTFKLVSTIPDARVEGDSDRLMQVMANLLSNAAKYSPEKDTVDISIADHENGYRLSVSDNGPGIPKEFQGRIFEKFSQADSSDTRQKGGTGLGLNITKEIIESHGGSIGFVSEEGKGATFFFDLAQAKEKQIAGQEQQQTEEANALRILVCEDEPDISRLLVMMLSGEGYATDTAFSAAEALEKLQNNDYDAMTLDIALPDRDGVSVFRELRLSPHTRDLPVIVVSARAEQEFKDFEHASVGIVDWLVKPIDQDRLAEGLRRAVRGVTRGVPRILHVEDDPDIIQIVAAVVGDLAGVEAVMSVAEARRILKEQRFDLVILDLMLPDGKGEDLLPLLDGESGDQPATPVIVFSAKEDEQDFTNCINSFLVKSRTSNETLLETIRSAIANRSGK